ncbi:ATP-dependent proteinase. Serine peptidase. MEROPS family S16 [Desulfatibacillum alkenivorans DSM 16219]|uniref:Lon protease n=2 Tax=Desulfatibacillum alkenivorans TaxID=259354 RepID=A0A1M6M1C3_9BACT|nr:ATP-dependent proteinase. Serine peptidase. MEROPS family S16 [Desulfatibacillum alkenivorans DSM 16219]
MNLPLLPLRDIVVFPHMVVPLFVGRDQSINALSEAMAKDKSVFLVTQKNASVDNPEEKDLHRVGAVGTVLQLLRLPDGTVKALVEGKSRAKITEFIRSESHFRVELEPLAEPDVQQTEAEAMVRTILETFKSYTKVNKNIPKDLMNSLKAITDPSQLADTVASHFQFKIEDKQSLLEAVSPIERLTLLLQFMKTEIAINEMEFRIKGRVKTQMEKTQRQYYLNEQMRAIRKEMGSDDEQAGEMDELERRIKKKRMPKEAANRVRQEFKKLKLMSPMSAEATVVRNYIDWFLALPWYERSKVRTDVTEAENILDQDHYGLEKPKERILEYLAVQALVKKIRGPILCLVGPPGVGKTSLAKSVARATNRKFVRLSLGGVRDEAEIRGHRRTYIGALPGKVIQSLKKVGVNNPVFCLDEVDKMSMDFRGDPSAALLEVLDPEQNSSFNDHYMDVDYDLSDILFITTANTLPDIPLPLQDRMEIIRIPGYTELEKFHIARGYLIPKQLKVNGLNDEMVQISDNAVYTIIRGYTREAGVRNLEREIASICRKVARIIVKDQPEGPVRVTTQSVGKHLGPERFRHGQIELEDRIGLVTGLAWTQVGGEILAVETVTMPGKGELIVTGKLGDVMKESARAAVSYVRSRTPRLCIDPEFHKKLDIHIHIPEGAIPKDGPSAGITMCTSIVSVLTGRKVRRDLAMTGEITLRGRILPIGGLKEKILAAHRAGIKAILIPEENEKDLADIPARVLKAVKVTPVGHMDQVLEHALVLKEGEALFNEDADLPMGCVVPNGVENPPEMQIN